MHGKVVDREGQLPLLVLPTQNKLQGVVHKGLSYWLSWLLCRRQKVLDSTSGQFGNDDAAIGIFFHKLLEIYYRQEFEKFAITCERPQDPNWLEALRLFAAYRELFPSNEFTRVVDCEQIVNQGARIKDPTLATTQEVLAARACREKFGVPELGAIIDNVVDIQEPELTVLKKSRVFHDAMEPGRYLLDTKTKKQRDTDMELWFLHEIQFKTYMMMAEDEPSIGPVKGLITNVVVRHKDLEDKKSFVSVVVPPPSPEDRRFVKSTLTRCFDLSEYYRARGETDPPNAALCKMYGGCKHSEVKGGTCTRV